MNPVKNTFGVFLLAVIFAGCASDKPIVVNQPVGPDLGPMHASVNRARKDGYLVVYSALEAADPVSSDYPTHAAYTICDNHGKFIQRVDNRSGSFEQSPVTISLPAGEYQVKAPATNHGLVTTFVIVKTGETTVLDLDKSHFRQHKPTGAGQWVRLPTGEIIGMRSQ